MNYLEIEKVIGRQIIDSTAPLESASICELLDGSPAVNARF